MEDIDRELYRARCGDSQAFKYPVAGENGAFWPQEINNNRCHLDCLQEVRVLKYLGLLYLLTHTDDAEKKGSLGCVSCACAFADIKSTGSSEDASETPRVDIFKG